MRPDDGLCLVRVIQALDVVEVRDIEGSDVVAQCQGKVGEFAIIRDVRVDCYGVLRLVAEVVEEFGYALFALGVAAEGVDDPDC